jgi:hypothetical protein
MEIMLGLKVTRMLSTVHYIHMLPTGYLQALYIALHIHYIKSADFILVQYVYTHQDCRFDKDSLNLIAGFRWQPATVYASVIGT